MNFFVKTMLFIIVFSFVLQHKSVVAEAQDIAMLAGLLKPPFVIPDKNQGMQIEIIDAAFAVYGDRVHFIYLPLSRYVEVYTKRNIGGIITLSENETELGLHLSKPYITYQNVVVTLEDKKININSIADLTGMRVAAFQNATKFLGDDYRNTFLQAPSYIELADQKSQLALLYSGRVDAIVLEINIFKHLLAMLAKESKDTIYEQKFVAHKIFTPKHYVAGFNRKDFQEKFDKGIETIKLNGRYQQIIDKYLK